MKKSLITLFSLLILASVPAFAQYERMNYTWEKEPEKIALTEAEQKEPAIYLKNYRFLEYAFDPEEQLVIYYTIHRHVRINSDDAIQGFNKVYIPMRGVIEMLDVKARTISPKGDVKVLEKSAIKDQKDEDGSEYKIFALEGIEKGSEVEYIYTVKKRMSLYGREYYQSGIYSRFNKFELVSPSNLVFAVKSYNNFPEPVSVLSELKNTVTITANNIPRLKEEKYGVYTANLMRVEYHLDYNKANKETFFTWQRFAQRIAQSYTVSDKKETKRVKKLIKDLKLEKIESKEEQVKALETYLKQNISYEENLQVPDKVKVDADFILKNKYSDEGGLLRIYAMAFEELGIPYEIAFTNDRNDSRFDPDFVSYNQLSNALLYFPETKKFMSPTSFQFRYGIIPPGMTHNYGIFIKSKRVGTMAMGFAEAKFIDALPFDESYDNLDIKMELDENSDKLKMDITRAQTGYYASFYPVLPVIKEEAKKEFVEAMITSLIDDAEIKKIELKNKDFTGSIADSTYIITASVVSGKMIERAGNKLLFKIGEAIGPQDQLYQEEERKTDVENTWNRLYYRKLTFTIPEGYKINNPEDLKMSVTCSENGNEVFAFVSDYKIEGSTLTVDVNEFYKQVSFPRERFEEFRKVINAAADFNKVILVLEKK